MFRNYLAASPRLLRLLAYTACALLFMAFANPALADDGKSWGAFFGRMHVVVLHLPIGLLIGAFALECFGLFRRSKGYDIAAAWLFVLGAASSVVAVVSGMLLGYEQAVSSAKDGKAPGSVFGLLTADTIEQGVSETMGWHMWLGITLMVAAIVAAGLKIMAVRKQWPDDVATPDHGGWPLGVARLTLIGAMAALPFAGHLGGNMTHGEKYLFAKAPFDVPDSIVYWPGEAPQTGGGGIVIPAGDAMPDGTVASWNARIQPALDDSCVKCHGTSKQNGDVRLDSLAQSWDSFVIELKKRKVDKKLVELGDAAISPLYQVITVPQSHGRFMPPDPKDAIDYETVAFIGEWIQNYDGRLEDPEKPKEPESGGAGDNGESTAGKPLIDPAAIRAIEEAGGSAQSLSQEESPDLLTIKFAYLKTLDPEAVAKIGNTAGQVAWLTFEGSSLNDNAVNQMPVLPKLTKLNLKDTQITDAGLKALPDLPQLEWLNLFGTGITDAGLDALKRYTTLDTLYITGTGVTEQGVAKLREALPDTQVVCDFDGQFQFGTDEPEQAANAKPVNTVCPVSGAPVKDGFVSTFEGKTVGFCCNNCKGKFDANPKQFAGKLP